MTYTKLSVYKKMCDAIFNYYAQADSMAELKELEGQVLKISDQTFDGFALSLLSPIEWFCMTERRKAAYEKRRAD